MQKNKLASHLGSTGCVPPKKLSQWGKAWGGSYGQAGQRKTRAKPLGIALVCSHLPSMLASGYC